MAAVLDGESPGCSSQRSCWVLGGVILATLNFIAMSPPLARKDAAGFS